MAVTKIYTDDKYKPVVNGKATHVIITDTSRPPDSQRIYGDMGETLEIKNGKPVQKTE